uniref:NADH-ubiquinone oxidoreductase chain 6 n=2 Tax=unclassified Hypothenemus TaxID=2620239 RepID=A0A343A4P5_9CUCU|nr:NADH dehydrogenase subunit 6 [Hypothenemus sp. BMNH 1040003]AOY40290.1 NADH dehydrogenase subunit 6 [Hypothenemus sp. KM-2015]
MTIIIMSYISIMMMALKHPLSVSMALIIQALLAAITTGLFFNYFWFGFILFLVIVGGVMILFVYMTSIASSEKFKSPSPLKSILMFTIITLMTLSTLKTMTIKTNNELTKTFMEYFNSNNMQMMIFLMIYLFVALIAVVKISDKNSGPLRQN